MAPEALFNPDPMQMDDTKQGLHQMIADSIKSSDIDVRKELYQNIILTGGTTMFRGLQERLDKELDELCPPEYKASIIA